MEFQFDFPEKSFKNVTYMYISRIAVDLRCGIFSKKRFYKRIKKRAEKINCILKLNDCIDHDEKCFAN